MKIAMFATVNPKGKVQEVFATLEQARDAMKKNNAARATLKRCNVDRQVAWSRGYNAARTAFERERWNNNKPKRDRLPSELFISTIFIDREVTA